MGRVFERGGRRRGYQRAPAPISLRRKMGKWDGPAVHPCLLSNLKFTPLPHAINSKRGDRPGGVSGARWMQGATGLPGQAVATRQRFPTPKE